MGESAPAKRPKHQLILDGLIADIEAGKLKPGQKLPPLRELIVKYDASVATVRRALWIAEDRGYIHGRRGSGIYVADRTDGSGSGG